MAAGDDLSLPLSTLLHMLTIKLSSSNYLLWRNQILPLLSYQKLTGHIDGTSLLPPHTVEVDAKAVPNPDYLSWYENDQRALIILQSSLSEEAMAETLGVKTARDVWLALEDAYSHDSVERMHTLRDSLRHLKKGNLSVSDYGRKFKFLCDQLAAIGHPVEDLDKTHWFLCGLGSCFETFSTTQRVISHVPPSVTYSLKQRHTIFFSNPYMVPLYLKLPLLPIEVDHLPIAVLIPMVVVTP